MSKHGAENEQFQSNEPFETAMTYDIAIGLLETLQDPDQTIENTLPEYAGLVQLLRIFLQGEKSKEDELWTTLHKFKNIFAVLYFLHPQKDGSAKVETPEGVKLATDFGDLAGRIGKEIIQGWKKPDKIETARGSGIYRRLDAAKFDAKALAGAEAIVKSFISCQSSENIFDVLKKVLEDSSGVTITADDNLYDPTEGVKSTTVKTDNEGRVVMPVMEYGKPGASCAIVFDNPRQQDERSKYGFIQGLMGHIVRSANIRDRVKNQVYNGHETINKELKPLAEELARMQVFSSQRTKDMIEYMKRLALTVKQVLAG